MVTTTLKTGTPSTATTAGKCISNLMKSYINLYFCVSFENHYILDVTACEDEFHQCQDNADLCEVSPPMRKDCPKTCGDCKTPGKCKFLITPLSLLIGRKECNLYTL